MVLRLVGIICPTNRYLWRDFLNCPYFSRLAPLIYQTEAMIYLREGNPNDYVLTIKGEAAKGYISTIPSVVEFVKELIADEKLYSRESVSITKDMEK